jgi:uncharacterized HAD superfamily protein
MSVKEKVVVGIDLDDVLFDFNRTLARYHNNRYGTSYAWEDISSWELHSIWGVSEEESLRRILQFYKTPEHAEASAVEGAVTAIERLHRSVEIVVVTARLEETEEATHDWIKRHFPSLVGKIHYTGHHRHSLRTKAMVCEENAVRVFIDDAIHNIETLAPLVEKALIFDAPWNRSYIPGHKNIHRIHSWQEICEKIERLL